MGAPNQLGLTHSQPAVHSADDALERPRLRILDEPARGAGAGGLVEDLCVESAGEQAAFVTEGLRHHHLDPGEFALLESHGFIVTWQVT